MKIPLRGFTLIELLVTLAVAGILLAVGVPGFSRLTKDNRLATSVNEFVASLNLARAEALRRGARVVVCKSSDQAACSTSNGVGWEDGWIVFVDDDADATVDSGETVVQVHAPLEGNATITPLDVAVTNYVRYSASGRPLESGRFKVCDDRQGNFGRQLQLEGTGRLRLQKEQPCP